MPITATDTSREQITLPLFNLVVVLVAVAGLMLFGQARWQFDIHDPDFFPLNLLLPLLAAFGLYQAVKAGLAWRRHARQGSTQVQIDGPGRLRPGDTLRGRWLPGQPLPAGTRVRLQLQCIDFYEDEDLSASERRRRHPQVAWEGQAEAAVPASGAAVAFQFRLPTELKRIRAFIERAPQDRVQVKSLLVVNVPFGRRIVKASADMLPVDRGWRLVVEATPSGKTVRAEIDLPIEVTIAERGGR